jgi:hypothetical protein
MTLGGCGMSAVIAAPELIEAAATDLATIGSTVEAAHAVAAQQTLAVAPAAADEVSAAIAQLFSQHAQDYQSIAAEAAVSHGQFVQNLTSSAAAYASAEDIIASLMQGFKVSVRSLGTALETGIVNVDGAVLRGLLAVTPPDLYPAFFVLLLFGGVGVAAQIGIIENIIQPITGLSGPI